MKHLDVVTTLTKQNAQPNTSSLIASIILSKCFTGVILAPVVKAVHNE